MKDFYLTSEKEREYKRQYYQKNREKVCERQRKYSEANREKVRESCKRYSMTHDRTQYMKEYHQRKKIEAMKKLMSEGTDDER